MSVLALTSCAQEQDKHVQNGQQEVAQFAVNSTIENAESESIVLGSNDDRSTGYGVARPTYTNNGGSSSGIISDIVWDSWGGEIAEGTGMALAQIPGMALAESPFLAHAVVAYDLGMCDGKRAYRRLATYRPDLGETFTYGLGIDVCWSEQ
ncbi:hypothetical protein FQV43_07915 [Corynebacterium sp. sy039]|nr:hypothetical protein FQV43_07915 [Corynebacterium sp. sy039]